MPETIVSEVVIDENNPFEVLLDELVQWFAGGGDTSELEQRVAALEGKINISRERVQEILGELTGGLPWSSLPPGSVAIRDLVEGTDYTAEIGPLQKVVTVPEQSFMIQPLSIDLGSINPGGTAEESTSSSTYAPGIQNGVPQSFGGLKTDTVVISGDINGNWFSAPAEVLSVSEDLLTMICKANGVIGYDGNVIDIECKAIYSGQGPQVSVEASVTSSPANGGVLFVHISGINLDIDTHEELQTLGLGAKITFAAPFNETEGAHVQLSGDYRLNQSTPELALPINLRLENIRKDALFNNKATVAFNYFGNEILHEDPYNPSIIRTWWDVASEQEDILNLVLPDMSGVGGGSGSGGPTINPIDNVRVARILKTEVAA